MAVPLQSANFYPNTTTAASPRRLIGLVLARETIRPDKPIQSECPGFNSDGPSSCAAKTG